MDNLKTANDNYRLLKQKADDLKSSFESDTKAKVHICGATCGIASGALKTEEAFRQALKDLNIDAHIHKTGCMGHCYAEPVVIIENPASGFPPIMYQEVNEGKAKMLSKFFVRDGDPRLEHIYGATLENDLIPSIMEFPRFNREKRIVMEKCGKIDPENIYEYIAENGYSSIAKAFELGQTETIEQIIKSGLRGRGGAGFGSGLKLKLAQSASSIDKTIICNADEGDPGAYMDRTILESCPHQVIEGIIIAGFAFGATGAFIYIRAEYPLAVNIVAKAIKQAEELGLAGKNILGTDFSLQIKIFQGSGAFVCGEETALIKSMEGLRGMPVHRPPFPVQKGFKGRPTVINNVKTLATIPKIIEKGVEQFRQTGTQNSPGTAIFSVVGDVSHPGLVEIPMGVTLKELIFDICGGVPNKKKFKAVQIGGPSGGCLPESFINTPIDFDSLSSAGAMMGSGGMVVMNEDSCVVDVARYFVDFTEKESCGKCTFCRIGTRHLLDILKRITTGEGEEKDLENLETLSKDIKDGSLCGLGRTAPNPVLTSLKYFRQEYEAHIKEKRCPAMSCRSLTAYYIDLDKCARGCDACEGCCPVEAVFTTKDRKKGIDQSLCVKCGECMVACPPDYDAVKKVSPSHLVPIINRPPAP